MPAFAEDDMVMQDGTQAAGRKKLSLLSYGSRRQFTIAVALVSVLPLLLVWYLTTKIMAGEDAGFLTWETVSVTFGLVVLIGLGIMILKHYVANITRLRHTLEQLVKGEYPDAVKLITCADDIEAIQNALNVLVGKRRNEILAAERRRVMIESLNTACHYFGQPLSVLTCCLDALEKEFWDSEEDRELLMLSRDAVDMLLRSVQMLKNTREYETEPYWQSSENPMEHSRARIIKTAESVH